MPDTRDELFLRLCVRQGLFTSDEGAQLLAYYRENARSAEGIGAFLVREEYMDAGTAEKFRAAIQRRADGHVTKTRKRATSLNRARGAKSAHGGHHPVRHHHVHAMPTKVPADPKQITLISIGAVVLLGAVVYIVMEMNKSAISPEQAMLESQKEEEEARQKRYDEEARLKAAEKAKDNLPHGQPVPVNFSESELLQFDNKVNNLRNTAFQASIDKGPLQALQYIDRGLADLRGEYAPEDRIKILTTARQEIEEMIPVRYEELKGKVEEARAAGRTEEADDYLEQIEEQCGKEWRTKLESS